MDLKKFCLQEVAQCVGGLTKSMPFSDYPPTDVCGVHPTKRGTIITPRSKRPNFTPHNASAMPKVGRKSGTCSEGSSSWEVHDVSDILFSMSSSMSSILLASSTYADHTTVTGYTFDWKFLQMCCEICAGPDTMCDCSNSRCKKYVRILHCISIMIDNVDIHAVNGGRVTYICIYNTSYHILILFAGNGPA